MTAEDQRRECCYPIIDWNTVEDRLARLSPMIQSIIRAKTKSFFEASIEDNLQSLSRGSNFHGAGYDGPKGLDIIDHHIAGAHDSHITAAPLEKLKFIRRCGGVPAYIQEVLVPEVLTKLITEDMGVSDCQARSVLKKSKEIGKLLNETEAQCLPIPTIAASMLGGPNGANGDQNGFAHVGNNGNGNMEAQLASSNPMVQHDQLPDLNCPTEHAAANGDTGLRLGQG
ncbi:hypothetical protein ACJ73_01437 [Blastomyces percursus]|uniref:Restriction of telomere capping protein 4 n=1 Tax=Blastomyces percursus TaxID=1658174 RepID=A0A1J9QED4_9EURO|nr:hypothetical protein ACJ73_01437 [Blastomyces percursus]